MSIPSINLLLLHPELGRRGNSLNRETQTSLYPYTSSSSSGWIPSCSWASLETIQCVPGASFQWDMPRTPPQRSVQEAIQNRLPKPPQLVPLNLSSSFTTGRSKIGDTRVSPILLASLPTNVQAVLLQNNTRSSA